MRERRSARNLSVGQGLPYTGAALFVSIRLTTLVTAVIALTAHRVVRPLREIIIFDIFQLLQQPDSVVR